VLELEAKNGDVALALRYARRAAQAKPDDFGYRVNLASAFRANRKWTDAVREYRQALKQVPGHPEIRRSYAWTLLSAGRHDEAIKELRALVPGDPSLEIDLGVALARRGKTGDLEEALAIHLRALEESHPPAHEAGLVLNTVMILWGLGRTTEAHRLAQRPGQGWPQAVSGRLAEVSKELAEERRRSVLAELAELELLGDHRPATVAPGRGPLFHFEAVHIHQTGACSVAVLGDGTSVKGGQPPDEPANPDRDDGSDLGEPVKQKVQSGGAKRTRRSR
jgi:tetratricopeptide (TPR) repeat protein